jgi:hypothetical protein
MIGKAEFTQRRNSLVFTLFCLNGAKIEKYSCSYSKKLLLLLFEDVETRDSILVQKF